MPRAGRSRDLERLLTFVDAIAAVAITLLVLPLVDVAGELDAEHHSVAHLIGDHSGEFWAFGLSFVVIARIWLAQHALMRNVIAANRAITLWLVLWAFAIVFLPFPTALLADGGSQTITKVLYIGTLTLSSVCLAALALSARRDPALVDGEPPSPRPVAVTAVLMALALAITLLFPITSYFPLVLLVFSDAIEAWLARRDRNGARL